MAGTRVMTVSGMQTLPATWEAGREPIVVRQTDDYEMLYSHGFICKQKRRRVDHQDAHAATAQRQRDGGATAPERLPLPAALADLDACMLAARDRAASMPSHQALAMLYQAGLRHMAEKGRGESASAAAVLHEVAEQCPTTLENALSREGGAATTPDCSQLRDRVAAFSADRAAELRASVAAAVAERAALDRRQQLVDQTKASVAQLLASHKALEVESKSAAAAAAGHSHSRRAAQPCVPGRERERNKPDEARPDWTAQIMPDAHIRQLVSKAASVCEVMQAAEQRKKEEYKAKLKRKHPMLDTGVP